MKIRNTDRREQIVLQITPMIDIVFQLLIFFIFTFKIVLPEGDFNIRMPSASASTSSEPSETPLLKIRLRANSDRELASLHLGDIVFSGEKPFAQLQAEIRSLVGDSAGPGADEQEVEIEADYDLKYRYVIRAITAITGYIDDNGQQHKLVERVRFAPLREQ
jgi:biopolymer transport protein ExbD